MLKWIDKIKSPYRGWSDEMLDQEEAKVRKTMAICRMVGCIVVCVIVATTLISLVSI